MTLPAIELWRWRRMSLDSWYVAPAAIDWYLPPAPELQQTSRTSLPLSIDETDERTDTRPLRRRLSHIIRVAPTK